MSAFGSATKFFHACESLQGWDGCKDYVAAEAPFTAQSEPLVDVHSVKDYCEWMAGLGKGPLNGCEYELHSSSYDEDNRTAVFFATFKGRHVADGGPVAPTQQQTQSDYVYALKMNAEGKIENMCKIWNAPWALKELGWA